MKTPSAPVLTALTDAVEERLPRQVADVVRRLRSEDLFLLAAGLAFYALVSVAPFAILVLWMVTLVTGKAEVAHVAEQLGNMLPAKLGAEEALKRVADLGAGLGLGALAALVWPATAYGSGLRRAFARLSRRDEEGGKGIRGRALALSLLGVLPGLALAGLVAAYLGTRILGEGPLPMLFGWLLALLFGFVASAVAVAIIFRVFVPRRLSGRAIARGSTVAGGAIAVVTLGYVIFLNVGVDFQNRYATSGLAAIILLAAWLFLTNALILVGFQVAQES